MCLEDAYRGGLILNISFAQKKKRNQNFFIDFCLEM